MEQFDDVACQQQSVFSAFFKKKLMEYFGDDIFFSYFQDHNYEVKSGVLNIGICGEFSGRMAKFIRDNYLEHLQKLCFIIWKSSPKIHIITTKNEAPQLGLLQNEMHAAEVVYADFSKEASSFDNFICDASNRIALEASKNNTLVGSVSDGITYICGDVGVGKTHLAKATLFESQSNGKKVIMFAAEGFVSDFISAVKNNSIFEFKKNIASVDLLIIDDLQAIIGKRSSMEELTNIICSMLDNGKRVMLTSTIKPENIANFSERLRSRISCGIIAPIATASLELKKMAALGLINAKKCPISLENIDFIISNLVGGVRELKGAINRIAYAVKLYGVPASRELITATIPDILSSGSNVAICSSSNVTINAVQKCTAIFFQVKVSDINSVQKSKPICDARAVAAYIARNNLGLSYTEIAMHFGGKSHVAIMQACKKITAKLKSGDKQIALAIDGVLQLLKSQR
jgi:chromosomal replication initiator protein